jgi:5-hydroxyisourate hydrolase-like protein (transthyretin family)
VRRFLLLVVLAILVVLGAVAAPAAAQPCDCGSTPAPCAGYWGATTVFTGRVERVTRDASGARQVTFTILERHRGISASDVVIRTGPAGQRCSLSFRTGREYIVYARPDETGALTTSVCLRTREIEDGAADLAYLGSLKDGSAPLGRISGQILSVARDLSGKARGSAAPVAGANVTLTKNGQAQTAVTDRAGDFAFESLTVGRYIVSLEASEHYYADAAPAIVELRDPHACAQVDRRVSSNGRVTGRVVDAAGQPIAGLTIELTTAGARTNASRLDASTRRAITNSAGRYEIARLPAGRFLVGINISARRASAASMPRVFHPGVTSVTQAMPITVPSGGQVALADLKLSPATSYVSLSGVVIDANGLPADNAHVYLKGAGEDDAILAEPATTDSSGRFVIAGLSDVGYRLFAERTRSDGQLRRVDSSDPIAVTARRGLGPVRLLLRHRY